MAMSAIEKMVELLGVKKKGRVLTSLDLSQMVHRGLPVQSIDKVCRAIAPGNLELRYRIVPKATLARRQRTAERRLSPEESDRVARLARLWAYAADVWGSNEKAQRFLAEPHPLLRGRIPRDLAAETEIGARAVEELLGRLKYGSAV